MRRTLISEVSTALELMVQIPLLRKEADGLGQEAPPPPKSDENESRPQAEKCCLWQSPDLQNSVGKAFNATVSALAVC